MKLLNKANRFVSEHAKLNYALKCLKHINDKCFVDTVLERNPENIHFQSLGDEYPDKIIYFIEIGTKGDGFFAEYRRILNYLYYAEEHALTPYIYINEQFEYIDTERKLDNCNFFDDFFNQYCDLTFDKVKKSKTIIFSNRVHVNLAEKLKNESAYSVSEEYLHLIANVAKKYIDFNSEIRAYIAASLEKINFMPDMLGVHVRGSDYKMGYKGHPVYVSAEAFLENTITVMQECGCRGVFLATDDVETIQLFQNALGNQVIFYNDVHRTDGTISVINLTNNEEHYKSNLAKEVIRDMMTLSKCKVLIAGMSQVSICAMISNLAWEKEFEKIVILDKGINEKGNTYWG